MDKLTKSSEDYIEAIYMLYSQNKPIKSVRISEMLGVSRPAVNKAMNELKSKGLILMDHYSEIVLTDEGKKQGEEIYKKHKLINEFLISLGVDKETAEIDCCKIEHVISDVTVDAIKKYLNKKDM